MPDFPRPGLPEPGRIPTCPPVYPPPLASGKRARPGDGPGHGPPGRHGEGRPLRPSGPLLRQL